MILNQQISVTNQNNGTKRGAFSQKSRKMLAKTSIFDIFTPLLCKNMRSENTVSDLVLMGLLAVLGVFVLENGSNRPKTDYAFALSGRNNTYNFRPGRCPELIAFGLSGRIRCIQSNSKKVELSDMPFLSKQHAFSLPERRHIAK